ncbi:benzoate 4-monooxygenase cytochrome p450 [Trichoderma cornu-damae]|uniref:Benzoate 4-monooxygenase cytochrome p450 n=1 Tax=Trichoderma cornu-damae TaxID=654480 RepID=A0A9P8QV46_9HYPO|nr:benzoate 4-monooxygenase cytochrome p450 [Trichoderma cornu-damae]
MENMPRLWLAIAALGAYICLRTVYRLYLHPLSHIPGPKLTACTHLYEFFYNIVRPGLFLFEIEKMHQQYGPIVRINPREVHVSDPEFYDEIYASSSRKRDKDVKFVPMYGLPGSMVSAVSHEQHRFRRGILKDFFSRRAVLELSESVNERVQGLMRRLDASRVDHSVVCLDDAFSALTSDIITSYCCGKHWSFIEDEDFRGDLRKASADAMEFTHITRFVPWLVYVATYLSPRALSLLMPGKAALFGFLESFLEQGKAGSPLDKRRTMVVTLADPSIPPKERTYYRLRDETFAILAAGTETTARVLAVGLYHLAMDGSVRDALQAELKQLMPTPDSRAPTWLELEQLPYLNAFINESLRMAHGVIGRVPLVAPTESLTYKNYVIPRGTPISSSAYIIHRNASVFPDPEAFRPERWIEAAQRGQNLKRHLVAFSKGSRGCIGINLANMELFLTVANFARRFNLELYDTTPEDVRIVRDMTMGFTRRGGVKVYAKLSSVDAV